MWYQPSWTSHKRLSRQVSSPMIIYALVPRQYRRLFLYMYATTRALCAMFDSTVRRHCQVNRLQHGDVQTGLWQLIAVWRIRDHHQRATACTLWMRWLVCWRIPGIVQIPNHYSSNYFLSRSVSTASWHFLPTRSRSPRLLTTYVLYCSCYITPTDRCPDALSYRRYRSHAWTEIGKRARRMLASTVWKSLPSGARPSHSLAAFKCELKTTLLTF